MKYLLPPLMVLLSFYSTADEKHVPISVETIVKTTQSWNGNTLPAYPKGQPEITILKIAIAPGVTLPWHQHPVINAGVLLKGELLVTTKKGKKLKMTAGDPITEVIDTWHYGVNTGTDTAEIMVFYAGIENQPITIKQ
ncbi:cupin domain-containing protein [Pseudoalteromonas aurantia]|uniref:Cupin type-2 domain-containing protein n=1 Tax=Pseudoalteromonas aurantia 208 TaxID=1314867 RepID=A0ABR9EIY1_9GAMM|nr:cupin domain-containing protein [Pseudoalteromonas aurantia]MBE0370906.1 hypothetical protein [Pseudoalteromonas aurantia 208]